MKPQGIVFDVEADGFFMESTILWCVVLKDINDPSKTLKVKPFEDLFAKEKILDFIGKYDDPFIVGHYILGYDVFMLLKFLGINFSVGFRDRDTFNGKVCTYIDTFYLSMYLDADREGHSVEYFGSILGLPKIDWRAKAVELGLITNQSPKGAEFKQWHEEMGVYCDRDCGVNIKIFWNLFDSFEGIYGKYNGVLPEHFRCGQKGFFLMSCQEFTGWKFDQEYAKELVPQIQQMMKEIEDNVLPKLPPRKLKKGEEKDYSMPKNPFKKDGSFSHHMLNFIEKHKGLVHDHGIDFYGKIYKVESQKLLDVKLPMEIKDSDDLKEWFKSQGWKPTMYNFQRGPDGKPIRDVKGKLIPTSPKMQEAGKLCPNLEALDGDLPKQIVKYLSLRNRLSVLTGWMENWRVPLDGRIGASRTGITPTHRQKHSVLVNIPKGSEKVLLGKEFRSLWIVEKGKKLVSVDQAGLEARVMGHYCVPMETKALTKSGWKGYDDLIVGEEILAYDSETKTKKWTPLLEKAVFEEAEVVTLENHHFKVRATLNHRWFVKKRNTQTKKYIDCVVETKDLTTACNIIVNAPMEDYMISTSSQGILDGKYGQKWIERVISRGLSGVESFLEGFMVADGHYQKHGDGRWRFTQNLNEHFEVALTSAYIAHSGYLNVAHRDYKNGPHACVTLNKKSTVTMQRMKLSNKTVERVWCPRTKYGSWVMRQGDVITITGNTHRYDNGFTADELLNGDPHSKNSFAFFEPELKALGFTIENFNKEDPKFKPFRDRSKNGFYALLYGCSAAKLASTLGLPESRGDMLLERFWDANPATKQLKDNVTKFWETNGQKKWLPAIDGRRLSTRKKSALLNTLFQSCGAISMDYAICFIDEKLGGIKFDSMFRPYYDLNGQQVKRIGYMHDQTDWESDEGVDEELKQIIEDCYVEAGVHLKLKVPLAGDGKIGANLYEVH